jgi:hypothetical protein
LYKPKVSQSYLMISADERSVSFKPDRADMEYTVAVSVTEKLAKTVGRAANGYMGCSTSYQQVTIVPRCNCKPAVNAGNPATLISNLGEKYRLVLDGAKTTDDDEGDMLTYRWAIEGWDSATSKSAYEKSEQTSSKKLKTGVTETLKRYSWTRPTLVFPAIGEPATRVALDDCTKKDPHASCKKLSNTLTNKVIEDDNRFQQDFQSPTTSDIPYVTSKDSVTRNVTYYYTQRVTQEFLSTCTAELRTYSNEPTKAYLSVSGEPSGYAACSGVLNVALTADDGCNTPKDVVKVSVGCSQAPIATLKCTQFSYWTGSKFEQVVIDGRGTMDPDGEQIYGTGSSLCPGPQCNVPNGTWTVTPSNLGKNMKRPYVLAPYSQDESTIALRDSTRERFVRVFTPGPLGDYKIRMEVTDGCTVAYDEIYVYARCPFLVAEVLADSVAYFDAFNVPSIALNGTLSTIKPQMKGFTKIEWTVGSVPRGSKVKAAAIERPNQLLTYVKPDRGGVYNLVLSLSDGCNSTNATEKITYSCGLNATFGPERTEPKIKNGTIRDAGPGGQAKTDNFEMNYVANQGFGSVEYRIYELDYLGRGANIAFTTRVVYPSGKTDSFGPKSIAVKTIPTLAKTPVTFSIAPLKNEVGAVQVFVDMDDGCQTVTQLAFRFTTKCSAVAVRAENLKPAANGAPVNEVSWLTGTSNFDKIEVKGVVIEPTAGQAGNLAYLWSVPNGTITDKSSETNLGVFSFRPTYAGKWDVVLTAKRQDGGCQAVDTTISFQAKCINRNLRKAGFQGDTFTAKEAIFPEVASSYWMQYAERSKLEVFAPQVLNGQEIIDPALFANFVPPLPTAQVKYRWAPVSPKNVKITGDTTLRASFIPSKMKGQNAQATLYNFSLTVNDGCQDYVYYYVQNVRCRAITAVIKATGSLAASYQNQLFPTVDLVATGSTYESRTAYYNYNKLSYVWKVLQSPAGSKYYKSGVFTNQILTAPTTVETREESLEPKDQKALDGSYQNKTVIMKMQITSEVSDVDMKSVLKNHGGFEAKTCFKPDLPGEYKVTLRIEDECGAFADANTVTVTATCPSLQILFAGAAVRSQVASGKGDMRLYLDASPTEALPSNTRPGNTLNFEWTLRSTPKKSALSKGTDSYKSITNYQASIASFRPDQKGNYVFDVKVSDGCQTKTRELRWTITCAAPVQLTIKPETTSYLTYKTNAFGVINIEGSVTTDPCNVRGWEWSLAAFNCTDFVPKAPPIAPPPVDLVCKPRFQYIWSLVDKPCKSTRTTSDMLDRFEKNSRFTPDVPGSYKFILKVSDDCSSAEATVTLQAMCRNKIDVKITANATSALSCSKGNYDPIELTAKYSVTETTGIVNQESCPAPTTPTVAVTPPSIEQRCCPECPVCPHCPKCPVLSCPVCNCPPYRVCQIVGGFDNCTFGGRGSGFRSGKQNVTGARAKDELTLDGPVSSPSIYHAPAPAFDSPAASRKMAGGLVHGTDSGSVVASLAAPSALSSSDFKGRVLIGMQYSEIVASAHLFELFKVDVRDFLASSAKVSVDAVVITSIEGEAEDKTSVSFVLKMDGENQSITQVQERLDSIVGQSFNEYVVYSVSELAASAAQPGYTSTDAEYEEAEADSRERVLWLAAVLPISVLLVLSIAVNVGVIGYYTRLVKGARFSPGAMQPQRSAV